MGIFDGYLLVSDIDGTLYHNNKIPPANLEAIEYFKSEGGIFTIATGRGIRIAKQICKEARVNAPVITTNGGVIYDGEQDKILHSTYLSDAACEMIKEAVRKYPRLGGLVTVDNEILTLNDTPDVKKVRIYDKVEYIPVESCNKKWQKILYILDDLDHLREIKEYFQGVKLPEIRYVESAPNFYEVLPEGISKATNFEKLRELIPCKPTKIFAIGDYYNDKEMVLAADIGAVTAEAPDDMKAIADYVSAGVLDGAVADFIYYLKNYIQGKDECNG